MLMDSRQTRYIRKDKQNNPTLQYFNRSSTGGQFTPPSPTSVQETFSAGRQLDSDDERKQSLRFAAASEPGDSFCSTRSIMCVLIRSYRFWGSISSLEPRQ